VKRLTIDFDVYEKELCARESLGRQGMLEDLQEGTELFAYLRNLVSGECEGQQYTNLDAIQKEVKRMLEAIERMV